MFITVHPLDRLLPPGFQPGPGWPAAVRALVPGEPVAWWAGNQIGSSAGCLISLWATQDEATAAAVREGSTPGRVTLDPASVYTVDGAELGAGHALHPGVVQLTWFAGPRTDGQRDAERIADQRVAKALLGLPGLIGGLICYAPGNARLVVTLADSEQTLQDMFARIMATELGPDEDPALLTGPDSVQVCGIADGAGSMADVAGLVGGGVR